MLWFLLCFGNSEQNYSKYMHMCMHGAEHRFQLIWKTPSNTIAGFYAKTLSSSARSCQSLFQSDGAILQCRQQSVKAFVVLSHHLSMDQRQRSLPLWQGAPSSLCFNCSCVVLITAHSSPIGEHVFNPLGHQVLILLLSPLGSWNRFKLITYLFPSFFVFVFIGGGSMFSLWSPSVAQHFSLPGSVSTYWEYRRAEPRLSALSFSRRGFIQIRKLQFYISQYPPKFINVMDDWI